MFTSSKTAKSLYTMFLTTISKTFLIKITTHDEPQEVIREDERNIIYFENYFTAIFKLNISSTEH